MRVTIEPCTKLNRIELLERGNIVRVRGTAVLANLPGHVAERELKVLKRELSLDLADLRIEEVKSHGPGNALIVEVESAHLAEVFIGLGELGVKAEVVAGRLAKQVRRYLDAEGPVGEHLADQILLPMALAGSGAFITFPLSQHALTNIEVLKTFLQVEVKIEHVSDDAARVEINTRP